MNHRVYLAGPDVFLPDPAARAVALKDICARHGLLAVFPLDPLPDEPSCWADLPEPHRIARRNEAHIRASDAIIANLTPFRGPGADAGTVYEVGFGRALGLPVFGFMTLAEDYAARVHCLPGCSGACDADGLTIEDFGLFENLMIACAIAESGGAIVAEAANDRWGDLIVFERCVAQAAKVLGGVG
jgi:nucleoside 2-deoxyribosyltransferase